MKVLHERLLDYYDAEIGRVCVLNNFRCSQFFRLVIRLKCSLQNESSFGPGIVHRSVKRRPFKFEQMTQVFRMTAKKVVAERENDECYIIGELALFYFLQNYGNEYYFFSSVFFDYGRRND